MTPRIALAILCVAALGFAAQHAHADPVDPTFDTFGELSDATWGGSGIQNEFVAITEITDGDVTITLGLAAHGRYSVPDPGNDGAGTFFMPRGVSTEGSTTGANWNFDFYVMVDGGTFADYSFDLLYDFDSAADTDENDLGTLDLNAALVANGQTLSDWSLVEGSENLAFSYLSNDLLPFISAPSATFDPYARGEYSFALRAFDGSTELGRSAIHVEVDPVPEPATIALLGLGLAGVGAARRRRRQS